MPFTQLKEMNGTCYFAVKLATVAGDTHCVYPFATSRREENERKNYIRKERDFSAKEGRRIS